MGTFLLISEINLIEIRSVLEKNLTSLPLISTFYKYLIQSQERKIQYLAIWPS